MHKYTDPTNAVCTEPFYNPHMVPSLKFVWLSRGVPLLGAQSRQQYPQLAVGPVPDLWLRVGYPGTEGRLATWRPPSLVPGFLDKTNVPPMGQRRQQYPQLALGPEPELFYGVGSPGVRTTFSHMATPLVLYPEFCDIELIFLEYWPTDLIRTGPFYNSHTVPPLNFAWLSRGVPLLGESGTGLLCPFTR